jgi:hypothetical protein
VYADDFEGSVQARNVSVVRVASFNVENLFSRPKAFNTSNWAAGEPALAAYSEVNILMANANYSAADKQRIRDLLVQLDIYTVNAAGAIRRNQTKSPKWAWLRKNRGTFDREPADTGQNIEIIAKGRSQ